MYYSCVTRKEDNGNDKDAHHHHYHHHYCCCWLDNDFLVSEEGSEFSPRDVRTYSRMQMGPKQVITCAAMYGYDTRKKLSFCLGKHTTTLQAEAQTINVCVAPNIDTGCKHRNSYTLTDS
jgi:hypothetical protein